MKDSTNSNINDMTASVIETDINKEVDNILNAESIDIDSVLEEINEKYGIHTKELDIDKLLSSEDIKESMSEDNILSLILNSLEAKELIKAIKDKANPPILDKETDLAKDQRLATLTKAFIDLAELYMDKANAYEGDDSKQTKIQYYTEATKLLNYALSTNQAITSRAFLSGVLGIEQIHNEIESKLEQIYIKVIALVGENINQAGIASAIEHAKNDKKFLKDLREHTRSKVAEIDDIDNDAARSTATNRLFTHITDQMKSYLAEIYHQGEETLGKAPCEYAIFGLGSMALGQMTPYSDLEFAILTANGDEQSKEYFRDLTCIVHLRIINLGETVINKKDIDDALIYHLINRGVNFDLGGKTPIAVRNKPELIATVDEMASYLKNINNNKNWIDTSNILETTVFVGGKEDLYDQFEKEADEFLFQERDVNRILNCEARALKKLTEGIKESKIGNLIDFKPKLTEYDGGKLFDAKQEIYRLPDRLISNVAFLFGVKSQSVWQDVALLKSNGIISERAEENLNNAIGFATLLRLKAYLHYGKQREDVHIDHRQTNDEAIFYITKDNERLLKFYYTMLPLHNKLEEISKNCGNKFNILQGNHLFDDSDAVKGRVCYRVMDYESAKVCLEEADKIGIVAFGTKALLGEVYAASGDYPKALKSYQDVLDIYKTISEYDYSDIISNIGGIHYLQGNYLKALEFYQNALIIKKEFVEYDYPGIASTIANIASVYKDQGNYFKALKFYQEALYIKKTIFGHGHPGVASTIANIASVYKDQGNYFKALKFYQEALYIEKTIFGHDHPHVASVITYIADVYIGQGDYSKALEMYQNALHIFKANLSHSRDAVATVVNNMANVYRDKGDYSKALEMYQDALNIFEANFGHNHPDVAMTINNMANVYRDKWDYSKALEMYQDALNIFEANFGHNHPDVAMTIDNMANVYRDKCDYSKALEMYQDALNIRKAIFGHSHPGVASTVKNIANIYEVQGNYPQAIEMYQDSLRIMVSFGYDHPDVALINNDIANVYETQNNYYEALKYYQKALYTMEASFGHNHPDVAMTINNIANVYASQGDYSKALEMYQDALNIKEEFFGHNHPDVAMTINNIANVYASQDDYSKALEMYQDALNIKEEFFGHNHPDVAMTIDNIASVYKDQHDYPKALEIYQDALNIKEEFFGHNHPDVASTISGIAEIYYYRGEYPKAMEYSQDALRIKKEFLRSDHPEIAMITNNIASIYRSQKDYLKAREIYEALLEEAIKIDSKENIISLYHKLACMDHIIAVKARDDKHLELMNEHYKNAAKVFKQVIELYKDSIKTGLYTEYANFLIQTHKFDEAIPYLNQVITKTDDSDRGLRYDQAEKITVDEDLQREIDFFNKITITDSRILGYYLLIKAQNQLSNVEQVRELIEQFKGYTVDNTDSLTYSLLGYSYKTAERFEEAANAFERAANLYQGTDERPEYTLAHENQAVCLSLISSLTTTVSNENNSIQDEIVENTEIRHMKPVYNNHILNDPHIQQIMQTAYQYGKMELVGRIISLGRNSETYKSLVESIKLSGIEATISKEILHNSFDSSINIESNTSPVSTNSINNKFIDQAEFLLNNDFTASDFTSTAKPNTKTNQGNTFNLQTLTISSFAVKEMIESAAMLKYFTYEVLGVQYAIPKTLQEIELPEFTKQNYFWVAMHYAAGAIGAFTLPTNIALVTKITTPIASTSIYGVKLVIYDVLTEQKQIAIQNGENKPINNFSELIEKCGLDIAAYFALSLINSGINKVTLGMPLSIIAYDIFISATLGGVQCYSSYQQTNNKENQSPKAISEKILPSVADAMVLYTVTKNMNFDFSSVFASMLTIKQSISAMSVTVITDQMAKLILSINREALIEIEKNFVEKTFNTVDKLIVSILGEERIYFNEANE